MTMSFILPWPNAILSPNHRAHWAPLASAKRLYRKACANQALLQGVRRIEAERLKVHLCFVPPDRRRRDWDNMIASMKSGFDGLVDVLGVDDSRWVVSHEIAQDGIGGFVRVHVEVVT